MTSLRHVLPEDVILDVHMVFQNSLFMLGCSWVIFLHCFRGYLGEHIDYDLSMQREDIRNTVHSTSKAMNG